MKPTLELPITIRLPRMDEVSMDSSVQAKLESWKTAKIVEGFKILAKDHHPKHGDLAFDF